MANAGTIPGLGASVASVNSADNDTSVPSSANLDTQPSRWTSASTSLTGSPAESRDVSPTRTTKPTGRTSRPSMSPVQSRKNSAHDPSPSRTRSNIPTSTVTPRQLSATTVPNLNPPSGADTVLRAPIPQKPSPMAHEISKDAPRWPISPRLKSPPPNFGRPTIASAARRSDSEFPVVQVQRATPSPHAEPNSQSASDMDAEESHSSSGTRTPARGPSNGQSTLETVQEVSQPNTPRPGLDAAIKKLEETASSQRSRRTSNFDVTYNSVNSSQATTNSESGSDSGSVRTSTRRSSSVAPPPLSSRQSSSTLRFSGRAQASGESSSRNMTVETEEVKDMPQLSLIPNVGGQRVNGSLRTRPSTETIKPKKEKKKHTRKATSVASGNASSKADIFEAKVASAVEEANSSDSDETFVYDSNPPDAERPRRFHSRTPSVASMASQVDRNGLRSIHAVLDSGPNNVHVKKSMKFVNTYNGNGNESLQGDDDGRGAGRSNVGSARGPARHHHGRWARNVNNHLSLFDNESPFPNASRPKFSGNNARQPSNPPSPRFNPNRGWLSGGKRQLSMSNTYDMDDATPGADDEQTPLLPTGTVRTTRSNRNRRDVSSRNLESQTYYQNQSFLNRFASCLVLTVMLLLVITGGIGFIFATSQPLTDVSLLKIGNVLASEQELLFDLTVQAHNPNVVVVMVDSADIEVFAKSPHAGNDSEWWRHPHGDDFTILDDPKDDPPEVTDPDDNTSPNMRLGNVHTFISPLTYEGSFFQSGSTTSSGELRLAHPGNTTESGTERWERIISDEFTLVIRGVLKYTLPLSQKVRKVSISGKTIVKPNAANDPALHPSKPEITISDKPSAWAA
ncbi:putative phospholipid metabolism enzyme regulator [Rosellinia necatrix]|uniref:Putative phospholipid metabolism enzyme regulator n=1 Tax=Rosellinia necatrix TaxID=77044 RepID=A0A1S7UKV7_ROSNE|nr:putative phospholipid metabolism enzyme regulator [Rosellinia necatrix]